MAYVYSVIFVSSLERFESWGYLKKLKLELSKGSFTHME
jgi:hypothetical protein